MTVEGLQVDNQLENAAFPVVLCPRPISSRDHKTNKTPTTQGAADTQPRMLLLQGQGGRHHHTDMQSQGCEEADGCYGGVVCLGLAPRQLESSPALHVYGCLMHTEGSDQAPLSHSPLLFFEALTLWIRPLELKLEESVVRSTHHDTSAPEEAL